MFIPPGTPLSGRMMDRFDRVVPGVIPDAFRPETNMEFRENQIRHDPMKWVDDKSAKRSSFDSYLDLKI